ncbi:cupin domain-containing protein [Portibacter marinus]|uniref:cupin domain-containing protein n=1 Tax=Portibacter marinus TaxID=2898660 RepID=UPI001F18F538|nr:cupin domain-containing protein [Portibacter marinus]
MMYNTFQNIEELEEFEVVPGIVGRMIHTDKMTMSFFKIAKGAVLPEHQHFHEQTSCIQSGDFQFTVDGKTKIVSAGDHIVIAPHTPHSALTDCTIIDVFVPSREDYK